MSKPIPMSEITNAILWANDTAKVKGWWEEPTRRPLEIHALIHSEISEAAGEVKNFYFNPNKNNDRISLEFMDELSENDAWEEIISIAASGNKPEGRMAELADVIIRVFDYAGYRGWAKDFTSSVSSVTYEMATGGGGFAGVTNILGLHALVSDATEAVRNRNDGKERLCLARVFCSAQKLIGDSGFPADLVIRAKMKYNETRPHRHGGKAA